jgi:acyl-CoA synthetase (AMP-forming)/AMP-acid ligase II
MPYALLQRLRSIFPNAKPYLMYGLTEAFRSTYLDPKEVDRRPGSIGKAIPNAEIMVVNSEGKPCVPGEEGELVHRGALVSLGYWNDPARTAERFRPAPGRQEGIPIQEMAVWSGDIVKTDQEGFLYYVGRRDDMIKTSGYRVSSTEIEEVIFTTGLVDEAVAIGVPHPTLGQGIVVVAKPKGGGPLAQDELLGACRRDLPLYMVPALFVERQHLPRNPNGKIDHSALAHELSGSFSHPKPPPEGGTACTPR